MKAACQFPQEGASVPGPAAAGAPHLGQWFEDLYRRYNRREYVHPDPVELLHAFKDARDREIAGVIAAALAYGRAAMILKSAGNVLDLLGGSPRNSLLHVDDLHLARLFRSFRHRFTSGEDMALLLSGIRETLLQYGTLEDCFREGFQKSGGSVTKGLKFFRDGLCGKRTGRAVLPDPAKGSACKRLLLYLKWMVRTDEIDPGGWTVLDPSQLLIPLDTHMFSVARALGMTGRKVADIKAAMEVTKAFSKIRPDDPLRYDFVITRFGIRPDLDKGVLLEEGASCIAGPGCRI